jgi:hypothetical protein
MDAARFDALLRRSPDDRIVRKAKMLLRAATAAKEHLSPAHRALVGKALALVIDRAATVGEDNDPSWLSDQYDAFFDEATQAEREHYQATEAEYAGHQGEKMLALANELDKAQTAVKAGADDMDLKVANALDDVWLSITESAANLASGVTRNMWPIALMVGGVLLAWGYARRSPRRA